MNTIGARVIYKLFQDNLFVSAINFRSGNNFIGYPWGSTNHLIGNGVSAEAPDKIALDTIG